MQNKTLNLTPVLITREKVQQLLGGMSRTTFWRRKKMWEKKEGKPFPTPAPGTSPIGGGEQYRYSDVIRFFRDHGFIDDTQADT
ncbi:hypothetical protein SCTVLC_2318 [Serratia symbiotica SCt-VLC]|uniref:Uncharacterized protein n=1 Tax=Serratia symbiotica SCt-VLC TaxID=1347341 RepID=A0A068RCG5_9GAMM|nr:hypothetical protein SCTVLC_2318 [Serratia symbiotica SCt-VLC]